MPATPTDVKRYRKRFQQSLDPRTIELQRTRKLLAVGLDPLTIGRIEGMIKHPEDFAKLKARVDKLRH